MWLKKFTLIICGMQFLFGVRSKKDEETVGLSAIAKLRAVAARAQLEHEIALHNLRTHLPHHLPHLPHHLLLAPNPLESLNSSEPNLMESTPSEFELLETPQTETSFEVNTPKSLPEIQSTFIFTSSSDETTMNYIQYDGSTKITNPQESTSPNPVDLVMKFMNHALTNTSDNATSITEQAKLQAEISTTKENLNAYVDNQRQHHNYTTESNSFAVQTRNSTIPIHDPHSAIRLTVEDNNSKHDLGKLPLHLSTTKPPNHSRNTQVFVKQNEDFGKLNEDMSTLNNVQKGQFMPKTVNFESSVHHSHQDKFHEMGNSFTRNSFEHGGVPMETQNDVLVQRRQHLSRNKQDEELFLQHLNMMQAQHNQDIVRTAEDNIDRGYSDQGISNSQQIIFYPIAWKINEACESPVQQYELTPIKYQISSEEDDDKPLAEKFRRLNKKMRDFQLGDYGDENNARAADPSDPRHFHSHSLEIHHTKHVRPSTYHSSFHKRKEFSSKFQPAEHSTHFSFQKEHWKEPPSTFDQTDYGSFDKQNRKDLSVFGQTEKVPSNFHSSSKSLDKHNWEDLSSFGRPSPTNFHSSSKSLDKQHREYLSIFDHTEDVPSPTDFHSSSKSLDKQHAGQIAHSSALTPSPSHITINNQNNFISTESVNGNQNIQIPQGNGAPISQAHSYQSLRGDQPYDRSELGSPYLFQFPRNADNRRFKRSFPLIKLFTDPNVHLDVLKTLENVGTVARNSFEDRRAPMYHVRNMVGSAKNTAFSTMKIPPQNAIVPSRYKIVDKKFGLVNDNSLGDGDGILKQTNDNFLGNEIVRTFQKVGNIVRESVRSGQETLQHMGDVFNNAKKAVSSTKYSTPRLLLPYARTPVLKRNKPEKIVLITPRFTDYTREDQLVGTTQNDDFVKLGDIMDAVGVSNPERKDVGISRLVLQRKKPVAPILDRKLMLTKKPNLQSRFGSGESDVKQVENAKKSERKSCFILREEVERNEIDEITDTLANLKNIMGTKTLQDFLKYMKQRFLLEHLKDKLLRVEQNTDSNENVGSGLVLSNDLKKPFMGRPSKTELTKYFRKNGDSIDEETFGMQGVSVSAINPQVYEKFFNETLKVDEKVKDLEEIAALNDDKIGDCIEGVSEEARVDVKAFKKLKKPFMGKKIRKDSKYFY